MIAASTLVLALLLGAPADPNTTIASLPESAWADSVTSLDSNVHALDTNVTELEQETTEGDETVIALTSDVLFAFDKADLSSRARDKILDLVADIPNGSTVRVHGHTDSRGSARHNTALSLRRAKAVASVIAGARPGLVLDVAGFGESRPVKPNSIAGDDNPDGRQQNRRVEIRFDR